MQFLRVPTNVQKHRNSISLMDIHVYNNHIFRQTCDSNKSVQIRRKVILRHVFVQITFETKKRNIGFYVLRQGVPEGRSSEGYASFKQDKPWHVQVIPEVVQWDW